MFSDSKLIYEYENFTDNNNQQHGSKLKSHTWGTRGVNDASKSCPTICYWRAISNLFRCNFPSIGRNY